MAFAVSPEEQAALDAYFARDLARLRGGVPANDPVAAPGNDNGLPAIPAGPGLPADAYAANFDELNAIGGVPGARQAAPPVATDVPIGPPASQPFDFTQVPAFNAPIAKPSAQAAPAAHSAPMQAAAFDAPPAATGPSPAEQAAVAAQTTGQPATGAVDPSQLTFADPGAPAGQPQRPQFATVGTNTFQPVQRSTRGAVDLAEYEQGPPGEPKFSVGKDGGLKIEEGEPGEIRRKPLEPQFQEAEGREEQAALDQQAAREYADDATLRQAVAIEDKIRKIEEDRVNAENDRLRRIQEKQDRYQSMLTSVSNDENPVDAYMAKRETGDKITAGIAMFLGELGKAFTGAENPAMKMFDSAIQADIEMQRDKRRIRTEGARTLYDMAGEIFDSEAARDAATREAAYARVQREAQRFQGFAQTPERRAQFDQMLAQLEQKRLGAQAQRIQATQGEVSVVERFDPKRMVALGGGKLKEDHRKRLVRLPDGSFAFSRDPGRTNELQKQVKVDAAIVNSVGRIRRLRQQPGAKTDPKIRAQINGAAADLFLALKQGANLGTLDKGSLEFRDEWIGKPNDLVDFGGADALLGEVGRAASGRVSDTETYELDRDPDNPSPVREGGGPESAQRGAAP